MKLNQELAGLLRVNIEMKTKPNFSDLARTYGLDRRTVKKIYENGGIVKRKKRAQYSRWDSMEDLIREKIGLPGSTVRGVYEYLVDLLGAENVPGTYESLKAYIRKRNIPKRNSKNLKAHPRFETEPGKQLQVDWIENLNLTLSNGEVEMFNIFSATLGWSRKHIFVYTKTKTTEDFKRCLITVFQKIGGLPREVLTDNMSAIVNIRSGRRTVNKEINQLCKDLQIELKLCKPHSPQTKGKCESANRFRSWIVPYDGELESVDDIRDLIDNKLSHKVNEKINETTGVPPQTLYIKEMEYLSPLPSCRLLETYLKDEKTQTVPPTLLVSYKGAGYSVPKKYIGKKVHTFAIENQLFIYCDGELITTHSISNVKINYHPKHYEEALDESWQSASEIREMTRKNLSMFQDVNFGSLEEGEDICERTEL